MATKKPTMKIESKQKLEFNILDEETRKAVIKCIQDRGKIIVNLKKTGELSVKDGGGYTQVD
jgi:hypothetical protein